MSGSSCGGDDDVGSDDDDDDGEASILLGVMKSYMSIGSSWLRRTQIWLRRKPS